MFDALTLKWTFLSSGSVPARLGHCLVWDQGANQLILHGGRSSNNSYFTDLYYYLPSRNTWTLESSGTTGLSGRMYIACDVNVQARSFYVHGGVAGSVYYSDLWSYNFAYRNWTRMSSGNSNVQLQGHYLVYEQSLDVVFVLLGYHPVSGNRLKLYFEVHRQINMLV
jgi:hypothetical protein